MAPRPYSLLDAILGCGSSFIKNLSLTLILPTAALSTLARQTSGVDGEDMLANSGMLTSAFSIGMLLGTIAMNWLPEEFIDSKAPFLVCAIVLLIGNLLSILAETFLWSLYIVLVLRFVMALGFGVQYCGKRRAAVGLFKQEQREWAFMEIELFNGLGQASGPILFGISSLIFGFETELTKTDNAKASGLAEATNSLRVLPPSIILALSVVSLCGILSMDIEKPVLFPEDDASAKTEEGAGEAKQPAAGTLQKTEGTALLARAEVEVPPVWVTAVVQVACLIFGITRNFMFFGFESAMIVVYTMELLIPIPIASIIAGTAALTPIISNLMYNWYVKKYGKIDTMKLFLIAEVVGISAACILIAASLYEYKTLSIEQILDYHTNLDKKHEYLDEEIGPKLRLVIVSSILFYTSVYFGAALGNSYALQYAQPESVAKGMLTKSAMVLQQQVMQSAAGKALGMYYCRTVLTNPVLVSHLGMLFLAIMLSQLVVLKLGLDPQKTARACERLCGYS